MQLIEEYGLYTRKKEPMSSVFSWNKWYPSLTSATLGLSHMEKKEDCVAPMILKLEKSSVCYKVLQCTPPPPPGLGYCSVVFTLCEMLSVLYGTFLHECMKL